MTTQRAWGGARPGAGRKPNPFRPRAPGNGAGPAAYSPNAIAEIIAASNAHARTRSKTPELNPFVIAQHPPRATPDRRLRMAMDETIAWASSEWSGGVMANVVAEGLLFLGYPFLAELAQRPEYRIFSETIATEMTRKWIKFQGTGDDDKTEKIKELVDFLDALKVRDCFCDVAIQDGFFGRSHLFLDAGDVSDEELKTPIGDGRDKITDSKVGKGFLKSLKTVEAVWTYPTTYNAQNPLSHDWYNPQVWYVMGREIHASRLRTFIGRPVPDMLKPAYSFGGLSLSQMAKPYVDIWLKTRESVGQLIHAFSVMVLMTDLQTILQPGNATGLLGRVAMFNALRDNQGTFVLNKTTEDFKNVSAPLSGLHELQSQAQEHMMSVARIPAVKFTGMQPSGLNASSEGEMRAFNDTIKAYQHKLFKPNLDTVIDLAMITLWGGRDPEITYEFETLVELTDKEKAEMRKQDADADKIYIDSGVLSPEDVRQRVVNDPESPYQGLDPEDVPEVPEEGMGEGGMPGGGPGGPPPGGPGEEDDDSEGGEKKKEAGASDANLLPFAFDAEFKEEDHPRAPDGKFGSGGGGSTGGEEKRAGEAGKGEAPASAGSPHATAGKKFKKTGSGNLKAQGFKPSKRASGTDITGAMRVAWSHAAGTGKPATLVLTSGPAGGWAILKPGDKVAAGQPHIVVGPEGDVARYEDDLGGGEPEKTQGEEHLESLTAEQQAFHKRMTPVAEKHGYQEIGTSIVPGDPMFSHKMFRNPETKERLHFYPHHDTGNTWAHFGPGGEQTMGPGGPAEVEAHLAKQKEQKPLKPDSLTKVGKQMGSNPGGVYEDDTGTKFYVKAGKSAAHVRNELAAAALYQLAGVPTLKYRPVEGGGHIATEMEKLDKDNSKKLSPQEIKTAQKDFVVHAWLSNWDAVGTGGDNLGTVKGVPTPLDLGGALSYRAQGAPKGGAFGNKVGEIDTLRSREMNPDAHQIFGSMTDADMAEAAKKVTAIPNSEIERTLADVGESPELAAKLIARKNDLAARFKVQAADALFNDPDADTAYWIASTTRRVRERPIIVVVPAPNLPQWPGGRWQPGPSEEGEGEGEGGEGGGDDAIDEWKEGDHPRGQPGNAGQFGSGGGGGGSSGKTAGEAPKAAAGTSSGGGGGAEGTAGVKSGIISDLLKKGATTKDILEATGWKAINVPRVALALGLKLEKTGNVYKGVPMSDQERKEAKEEALRVAIKRKEAKAGKAGLAKPEAPKPPEAPKAEAGAGPQLKVTIKKTPTAGSYPGAKKIEDFAARVEASANKLPASHRELVKDVEIEIVTQLPKGENWAGLYYSWQKKVGMPQRTQAGYQISNEANTIAHELGHAIDHKHGWQLGNIVADTVNADSKGMTADERKRGDYWFKNNLERFAELYAVAYGENRPGTVYYGGMDRARAEKVFANSITLMKSLGIGEKGSRAEKEYKGKAYA